MLALKQQMRMLCMVEREYIDWSRYLQGNRRQCSRQDIVQWNGSEENMNCK